MVAVTYPHPDVERYIEEHFVPVQYNVVEQPEVMERFNSTWTPTLIFQAGRRVLAAKRTTPGAGPRAKDGSTGAPRATMIRSGSWA